ncbi:hypothetical protein ACOACO_03390 [Nocardioides sp. CPCC 205120]|uniref:hypothetical protein n=1 Tax=Nocardioides sp. CPCC 205120 TaxID=3406462 RepID=UPI003B5115E5
MTKFTVTHEATEVLPVERQRIWDVLTDPHQLASLTPMLTSIEPYGEEGQHWRWRMTKVPALSTAVAPEFTERMTFTELERIEFRHDPPAGAEEDAGAEGWYALEDASTDDGPATHLAISLAITVDLPLPRVSAPAVKAAMKGVVGTMGNGFAGNLEKHLGLR